MISKELLSVVLDIPLQHIRYNGTTNHYKIFKENLFNWNSGDYGRWSNLEINIYELAHKCKEWALTKGYFIYSTNELSFIKTFSLETIETFSNGKDTEIECILKACEYILKELNENR